MHAVPSKCRPSASTISVRVQDDSGLIRKSTGGSEETSSISLSLSVPQSLNMLIMMHRRYALKLGWLIRYIRLSVDCLKLLTVCKREHLAVLFNKSVTVIYSSGSRMLRRTYLNNSWWNFTKKYGVNKCFSSLIPIGSPEGKSLTLTLFGLYLLTTFFL